MEKREAKHGQRQLYVRVRESTYEALKAAAEQEGLSLNAEVARRIESSFSMPQLSDSDMTAVVVRVLTSMPVQAWAAARASLEEDYQHMLDVEKQVAAIRAKAKAATKMGVKRK